MSRIKGKYVATVEINYDFEESKKFLPFNVIKSNIENEITPNLLKSIQDEVPGVIATVEIIPQSLDCYRIYG